MVRPAGEAGAQSPSRRHRPGDADGASVLHGPAPVTRPIDKQNCRAARPAQCAPHHALDPAEMRARLCVCVRAKLEQQQIHVRWDDSMQAKVEE